MKNVSAIFVCTLAFATTWFVACSSNNSNPASNNNSNNNNNGNPAAHSFSPVIGSTAQYDQWTTDSTGKIPNSDQLVHETFVAGGLSYQGMQNVYLLVDSIFHDTTTSMISEVDSFYTIANGGELWQFGAVSKEATILGGSLLNLPQHWDMVANEGNTSGWMVDTASQNIPNFANVFLQLNGKDVGDTNITVGTTTLLSNHSELAGTMLFTAGTQSVNEPLHIEVYTSYANPTATTKYIIAPAYGAGIFLLGSVRALQSWK